MTCFSLFERIFCTDAPLFRKNFDQVRTIFGDGWMRDFDAHLDRLFGQNEQAYRKAIQAYAKFCLSAMRLQSRFNQTRRYEEQSYQDTCRQVYQNEEFMSTVYLPGIFVSQFLWQHHYRQIQYYRHSFLPLLDELDDKRFYDVGTGTGFYSAQILRQDSRFLGYGIDPSPHARRFTARQLQGWGFCSSYTLLDADITDAELEPLPCVQSIEVLEHLSDPERFLKHLRTLLQPGGYGFIAAAITAPEDDHIYLYWTPDDVIRQLRAAGFDVMDYREEPGYEGRPGEIVPKVAAFIVR